MNWITIATTVLQLLPAIITAIKAIEEAIPGQGRGEDKLAAIRGILEGVNSSVDAYWPALEKAIGVIVGLFNRTGVFAK
jgi:hypothetical protein